MYPHSGNQWDRAFSPGGKQYCVRRQSVSPLRTELYPKGTVAELCTCPILVKGQGLECEWEDCREAVT